MTQPEKYHDCGPDPHRYALAPSPEDALLLGRYDLFIVGVGEALGRSKLAMDAFMKDPVAMDIAAATVRMACNSQPQKAAYSTKQAHVPAHVHAQMPGPVSNPTRASTAFQLFKALKAIARVARVRLAAFTFRWTLHH